MFCEASKVSRTYVWITEKSPFCLKNEGNRELSFWDKKTPDHILKSDFFFLY